MQRPGAIITGAFLLALLCQLPASLLADGAGRSGTRPRAIPPAEARRVYRRACAPCHGRNGDGNGPAAPYLSPRPRDLTRGVFKIRSTAGGEPPTDRDLFDVITRGMPGTSMPAWGSLPEAERWGLVQYIKLFSDIFADRAEPLVRIDMRGQIEHSEESVARGRKVFETLQCSKCHGGDGKGKGPSAHDLIDGQGVPIRPRNLTHGWTFRGGGAAADIYRRILGGLGGPPMESFLPSFTLAEEIEEIGYMIEDEEAVTGEQRRRYEEAQAAIRRQVWDLANYVVSLSGERSFWFKLFAEDTEATAPWDDGGDTSQGGQGD